MPTLGVEFLDGKEFKHGDTASDVFDPYPPTLKWNENPYVVDGNNVVLTANNGVNVPDTSYAGAILFKDLPAKGTKSNNYNIITSSGDLTVTKQPIQFAWNPSSTILTYGDMLSSIAHLNATSASTITIAGETHTIPVTATYVALDSDGNAVGGNLIGGTLDGDKKLVGGTLALAAKNFNAGTVNVKVTVAVDEVAVLADADLRGNVPAFGAATQTIAFSVGKKGLNVVADDQTKIYNTEAFDKTDITYTTADFVAGEDATFIKKAPTVADPTNKTSNVGDYSIIPSGGEDENYAFIYKAGKFTVEAAATAATWDPEAAGGDAKKHHREFGSRISWLSELALNDVDHGDVEKRSGGKGIEDPFEPCSALSR